MATLKGDRLSLILLMMIHLVNIHYRHWVLSALRAEAIFPGEGARGFSQASR